MGILHGLSSAPLQGVNCPGLTGDCDLYRTLHEITCTTLVHGAFQSKGIQSKVSRLNSFDKARKIPDTSSSSLLFCHGLSTAEPRTCLLLLFCIEFQLSWKHVWKARMSLMVLTITVLERFHHLFYLPCLSSIQGVEPQVDVEARPCWNLSGSLPSQVKCEVKMAVAPRWDLSSEAGWAG